MDLTFRERGTWVMDWYLEALRRYSQFDGRARRKEFWHFQLFNAMVFISLILLDIGFASSASSSERDGMAAVMLIPVYLYWFVILVPSLAVLIRRLHDIGRTGWWALLSLVPGVGGLVLLILTCLDSEPGPNAFGPNPKGSEEFMPMAAMSRRY